MKVRLAKIVIILVTIVAIFFALVVVATTAPPSTAAPASCPSDYTVLVGGTGDPTSAGVPFKPIGQVVRIQYPASIFPAGSETADVSVQVGEQRIAEAVIDIRSQCPGATIHLAGYSLGAWVAGNYCDRDPAVRCTLISDPRKPGGINAYLFDLPGITFQGPRAPTANVKHVCGEYDVICVAKANDPAHLLSSAWGYVRGMFGRESTHGYWPAEEPDHDVVIEQESPIPGADVVPAIPFPVPTPRDIVQPAIDAGAQVSEAITPNRPAVEIGRPYTPTPVGEYLPPVVRDVLPPAVTGFIPPPAPALPSLPPLPVLPTLPGL